MTRSIIVGNGFLKYLNNALYSLDTDEITKSVCSDILETFSLFNNFKITESRLQTILKTKKTGEDLFEIMDNVLLWHRSDMVFDNYCYKRFKSTGREIIEENFLPLVKSLEAIETKGSYTNFYNILSKYKIGDKVFDSKDDIGFFTTNYDGYLEHFLRKSDQTPIKSFVFEDGFAGDKNHSLRFYGPNFKSNKKCIHLHSSYKFGWKNGECIKHRLFSGEENSNPNFIYYYPNDKEFKLKTTQVLDIYWQEFINWIASSDEVVIFGQSLQNDPHIVKVLNQYKKHTYIVDIEPNIVASKLDYKENIIEINANNVALEKISELFTDPWVYYLTN